MSMYDPHPHAFGRTPPEPDRYERKPIRDDSYPLSTREERPIGVVVSELWENTEKLVRAEMQLGLAEIDRRVSHIKKDVTLATAGGAVMYAGVLSLVAALVMLLSKALAPWLSALIVGAVVAGAGFVMLQRGKNDLLKPKEKDTSSSSHTTQPTHALQGGRT